MISAVLDACVLYSAPLRDFLLRLAFAGLIDLFWSKDIQNEWISSLLKKRPELEREKLERTRREMESRFPNGLVHGYEPIIRTLQYPTRRIDMFLPLPFMRRQNISLHSI